MSTAMTGAKMVVQALKDQGVEVVFGYPGGAVLPIYDEIFQQNEIRHILVRHEQGAVHMAEGYARSTGKPGVVLVTSGPGATNAVTGLVDALMEQIRNAMHRHGTATGYYPVSLDALVPRYLDSPPRTSAGEEFIYNNQNGELRHPRENMRISAQPQRRGGMAVGGAGPMGEAMTGIGVMNELNRMNQSGTSSAGSRARGSAHDISNAQNDRTSQAMDELGL